MARATILSLAVDIAEEAGLAPPLSLFGVSDGDTTPGNIRRALGRTGRWLQRYWDWPELTETASFTAVANGLQGTVPADFDRIIPDTVYDVTHRTPVAGPVSWSRWQALTLPQIGPAGPNCIIKGTEFHLWSPWGTGATIQYLYVRDAIAKSEAGADRATLTADTDVMLWDDEIMRLGARSALQSRDGMPTSGADGEAFMAAATERMTQLADSGLLDMGGCVTGPAEGNWPQTGWGD